MDAVTSPHPPDPTLDAFAAGRLDGEAARVVGAHLNDCSECRERAAAMSADSFLRRVRDAHGDSATGPSRPGGTAPDPSPRVPPADTLPPGLADHPDYEVKKELGRGGMGVVYLVHNTLLGRDEVLKVIGRHVMERPGVLDRFLREMRAVARLRHPNIVSAYSASRLGESLVFAMEYVDGLDLSRLVKAKGPLPVAHAANFAYQAALGLQHAHEEGLVHRDIKPANLMLARRGEKPVVKVLDFGLAKAAQEEKADGALTSTGQALGTPDYIAPEQILDAPSADVRADIYSLGGTLYYLLTGRPPFKANSLYDLYQAHISRDADVLNLVRPEVPSELGALVAKMLAKDPSKRFQTPGEVAEALTPFFKKASAAYKAPKPDVSRPLPAAPDPARPSPRSASSPADPTARPGSTAPGSETRWDSLIEFREGETAPTPTPAVAGSGRRAWHWPAVGAALLTLGFLSAWLVGVFRVKTAEGVIALKGLPDDAEVFVDGDRVTITRPGEGQPVVIRVVPGQRKVEVKKGGFRTFGEVVALSEGGRGEIEVRLEPLATKGLHRDASESALAASTTGSVPPVFVPLFNGKDTTGWTPGPTSEGRWEVAGDSMVGIGGGRPGYPGFALSDRKDYANFRLRFSARCVSGDGIGIIFRHSAIEGKMKGYLIQVNKTSESQILSQCSFAWLVDYRYGDRYDANVTLAKLAIKEGEWFDVEVGAINQEITWSVNGKVIGRFVSDGIADKTGEVGLFCRYNAQVEFRSVEIHELGADGEPVAAESPVAGGSLSLFNGKDLTGWRVSPANRGEWRVSGGILEAKGSGVAGPPAVLVTERQDFTDYRLRARFRYEEAGGGSVEIRHHYFPEANARSSYPISHGVWPAGFLHARPPGKINKLANKRYGDGFEWNHPAEAVAAEAGRWHTLEIEAVKNRITTRVNGTKVSEYTDEVDSFPSGAIALQVLYHSTVQYRDVEIEEFPEPSEPQTAPPDPAADASGRNAASQGHAFVPLFNGTNLDGWKDLLPNGSEWGVADGVLTGRGAGPGKPAVLLSTGQSYGDFRLRAKARYPNGGTGAIEVRLNVYGEKRDGYLVDHGTWPLTNGWEVVPGTTAKVRGAVHGQRSEPARVGLVTPEAVPVDGDAWHLLELEAIGDKISFAIDGKRVSQYVDQAEPFERGAIALVCFSDFVIQFQEILIEDLSKSQSEPRPGVGSQTDDTPRKPSPRSAPDRLQPGTKWAGVWTFEDPEYAGKVGQFRLEVTERAGKSFKAASFFEMDFPEEEGTSEGKVEGNRVTIESLASGQFHFMLTGTIRNGRIEFQFDGTGGRGVRRFGRGEVTLVPE